MNDKTIVLTMYGTRKAVSDFSITFFDNITSAQDYCSNINGLKPKDDNWIHASIIRENQKIKFEKPGHTDFDMLSTFDNRVIQKIIYKVERHVLAKALKISKPETFCAVLRNISKRAAIILNENMEYMGPVRLFDVIEAQRQIVELIRSMEKTGEIRILNSNQDVLN
jgi:flagellar motor switch protein FliG